MKTIYRIDLLAVVREVMAQEFKDKPYRVTWNRGGGNTFVRFYATERGAYAQAKKVARADDTITGYRVENMVGEYAYTYLIEEERIALIEKYGYKLGEWYSPLEEAGVPLNTPMSWHWAYFNADTPQLQTVSFTNVYNKKRNYDVTVSGPGYQHTVPLEKVVSAYKAGELTPFKSYNVDEVNESYTTAIAEGLEKHMQYWDDVLAKYKAIKTAEAQKKQAMEDRHNNVFGGLVMQYNLPEPPLHVSELHRDALIKDLRIAEDMIRTKRQSVLDGIQELYEQTLKEEGKHMPDDTPENIVYKAYSLAGMPPPVDEFVHKMVFAYHNRDAEYWYDATRQSNPARRLAFQMLTKLKLSNRRSADKDIIEHWARGN